MRNVSFSFNCGITLTRVTEHPNKRIITQKQHNDLRDESIPPENTYCGKCDTASTLLVSPTIPVSSI